MEWNRMECNVMNINGPEAATHMAQGKFLKEKLFFKADVAS